MNIEPVTPDDRRPAAFRARRASTLLFAVGAVALLAAVFGLAYHDIDSTDICTHLAAGEDILSHGRVPQLDPFDHSDTPRPWINAQWLTDVVLALLMRLGGTSFLVLWSCFLVSVAVALPVGLSFRRVGASTSLLVGALLTLLIANERFLVRPELVSLLAVVILHAVLSHQPRLRRGSIALLFVGQVVWTNAHPAFLLGPLLVALHLLSALIDRWRHVQGASAKIRGSAMALAALLIATMINPWGIQLPLHTIASVVALSHADLRQGIVEWQPPFAGPVASDLTLLAFLAALTWSIGALWAARRHASAYEFVVFVLMTALALQARRHLALYAVLVPPWIAMQTALSRHVSAQHAGRWRLALHVLSLLAIVTLHVSLSVDVWRGRFYERFGPPRQRGAAFSLLDHPNAAIAMFQSVGRPLPLFNNVAAGSHLLWADAGRTTPYIDGRLLAADTFREYRSLLGSPARFTQAAQSHGWRAVLLSLQPHAPVALFRALYEQPQWHLLAFDASGALFVRDDHATVLAADGVLPIDLNRPLPAPTMPAPRQDGFWQRCDPGPLAARGALLLQLGFADAARSDLAGALQHCSSRWEVGLLLSTALLDLGRTADALPLVERALREDAGRAEAWTNLGRIHASTGNWSQARACWQHALEVIPADPAAARYLQQAASLSSP